MENGFGRKLPKCRKMNLEVVSVVRVRVKSRPKAVEMERRETT